MGCNARGGVSMACILFFPALLLLLGVGGYASRLALYGLYKLTGGRKKFRSWYRAMQF